MENSFAPIDIALNGSYLSIGDLVWNAVPPFALLTGVNGAGKSQLLEALFVGLAGPENIPPHRRQYNVSAHINGATIRNGEVHFVQAKSSLSAPAKVSAGRLEQDARNLWQQAIKQKEPRYGSLRLRLEKDFGRPAITIGVEEFIQHASNEPSVFFEESQLLAGLGQVFLKYRSEVFELLENDKTLTYALAGEKLGHSPWEVLNTLLSSVNFPYSVPPPEGPALRDYEFRLLGHDGLAVKAQDLSSGEQQILSIVLWLFRTEHKALPKLLLLDEPDAYLHPSLTREFLRAVNDVLVNQYNVRVIMTTHSPSTVALAPDGALFEMRKKGTEPRVIRSESKWATIGLLTSGLITVGSDSKNVFVEDNADVQFYNKVFDLLKLPKPLSDEPAFIRPSPSLIFIASSASDATPGDPTGGRMKVTSLVAQLEGTHTHGIVDMDDGNKPVPDRVHVIGRYEMENYLFDPILVYANQANVNKAPALSGGQKFTTGTLETIQEQPRVVLEEIRDIILNPVRVKLTTDGVLDGGGDDSLVEVQYVNGSTYSLPCWFLHTKGKKMIDAFRQAHGNETTLDKLKLTLERTRWIPCELATILRTIQDA